MQILHNYIQQLCCSGMCKFVVIWSTAITCTNDDQDVCSHMVSPAHNELTHWGRVTHICVTQLITIVSDNGLSLHRRQAITWNNDGILLVGHVGRNFSEILIEIYTFAFKKMHLKMSSEKWRPSCLSLNVLRFVAGLILRIIPYDKGVLSWFIKRILIHHTRVHFTNGILPKIQILWKYFSALIQIWMIKSQ